MAIFRALYISALAIFSQVFAFGAAVSIETFLIPSILMGLGVAIDVSLATLTKFNDKTLSWRTWTIPVTFTHTAFPAIGYFLFWSTSASFPAIKTLLGITGFVLVALFVYEVICESINAKPVFGISEQISKLFGFSRDDARITIAVLAVSWDALWSGPAKAAQATTGAWSTTEVIVSFFITGLVVAIIAELSLFATSLLRKKRFSNIYTFTEFSIMGKYMELSVIGGFGILSLLHVFTDQADIYVSIAVSSVLILIAFSATIRRHWNAQINESKEILTSVK